MTDVLFDFRQFVIGAGGVAVSGGFVELAPSRRVVMDEVTSHPVVLPHPFAVPLVAGQATVVMRPSGPDWFWIVTDPAGGVRRVAVPDSEIAVNAADLVDVDPASFLPAVPGSPVGQQIAALDGRVTSIEENGAGGAGSQDVVWNGTALTYQGVVITAWPAELTGPVLVYGFTDESQVPAWVPDTALIVLPGSDADSLIAAHVAAANPHPQYAQAIPCSAAGDWTTDDTAAIQAAIATASGRVTAAAAFGVVRCVVQLEPGRLYKVTGLSLPTGVALDLAGSTIKLADGANTHVIATESFATLTGTDTTASPHSFQIRNGTIDGNRANQSAGARHAVAIYGYGYNIDNVVFRHARGFGLWTEWGSASPFLAPDGMEAMITNFKIHDTDQGSIYHKGPHDAQFIDGFVVKNSGIASGTAAIDLPVDGRANGSVFTNVHVYGGLYDYCLRNYSSGLEFIGCQFEGAQIAETLIGASMNKMSECKWFPGGVSSSTVKAIVVGDATHTGINNLRISGKVENTGGAILDLTYSAGNHRFDLFAQYTTVSLPGTPVVGSYDSNSRIDIHIVDPSGSAAASIYRWPTAALLKLGRVHFIQQGVATGISTGAAAGSSAPAATLTRNPSDARGIIRSGTGTGPTAGTQATVTFGVAYSSTPVVTLTPQNAATAALQPYVANETASGFEVGFAVAPAASQGGSTYSLAYHVLG